MTILAERTLHSESITRYFFLYVKQIHCEYNKRQFNGNAIFIISYNSKGEDICLN